MSNHNCDDHYRIGGHCRICGKVQEQTSELAPATGSVKSLNWQIGYAITLTVCAVFCVQFSWQFSLGVVLTAWITCFDHKYGKE